MRMELRHLRYFLAVAEELNFSRAATRLHVAQPALSAQIRSLESQLGCALFARTTRRVTLTPAGEVLLSDAREILARADEAVAKVQAVGRGERGLLRIGFAAHGAGEVGMEILRRFAASHPQITAELVNAETLEQLQRDVRDRRTDLAFVWLPLLYDELVAEPVLEERKLIAMHIQHPLATKLEVCAADLLEEPIVAPWEQFPPQLTAAWFQPFRAAGRRPGDPNAITVEESLHYASRGIALYCVPESVSRFYPRPDIVFRPIVDVAPVESAIAWRRDTSTPARGSFVETARAVLAEGACGDSTI